MAVYLDELFLLNLVINYLLLLAAAMLCTTPVKRPRILGGASAGALYACLTFFPELHLFYTLPAKAGISALMCLIAYGFHSKRTFLRRTLVFYAVSFAFAGAMMLLFRFAAPENSAVRNGILYAQISSPVLIAATAAAYLLMTLLLKNTPGLSGHPPPRASLVVTLYGKDLELEAMVDTGNRLCDPLTNDRVVVVEYTWVRSALPQGMRAVLDVFGVADAAEALRMLASAGYCEGLRLVPYTAVGTNRGLLLALRADHIREGESPPESALVALTETRLSEETGCCAVIGA